MPRGVLLPNLLEDWTDFGREAESLGYDRLWTGELWGRDAFVALSAIADETDEIALGTDIVNVWGRTPATLAQAAATLRSATGRDVTLGLGTSTEKTVEDLHGMAFENPPRRLHETVELTKEFLHGDGRVDYESENFDVADFPALETEVPVYTAALGPATRRATGRTADGWLPHNVPFERLGDSFEVIADAAESEGRDPDAIEVVPYVPAAVGEDPEAAVAAIRAHVAYYVGNGEGYRKAVAESFPDGADAVADAWRSGDRDAARAAVTDEMVAALGVAGTPEEAREQFEAVAAMDVIDEPMVVVPTGAGEELTRRTVRELAPEA